MAVITTRITKHWKNFTVDTTSIISLEASSCLQTKTETNASDQFFKDFKKDAYNILFISL